MKYLNYLLTLMSFERSKNNRDSLQIHLDGCDLEEFDPANPGTCKYCLRTIEMLTSIK